MHTYARVVNGVVTEVIEPMTDADDNEIPIAERFPAAFVAGLTDVSAVTGIGQGWTETNGTFAGPSGPTLAQVQASQWAQINAAYLAAIAQPVSFRSSGGVTEIFDADANSQLVLMQAAQGYGIAGSVPSNFFWVAEDGTHVPFTLADLQGLYQAMLAQGWAAFQHKQSLKAQIYASTATSASVQAIIW